MVNKKTIIQENSFTNIHTKLSDFGATYVSLFLLDKNNEIMYSKSSNPEWIDEFTSTGLYKSCHLLHAAFEVMSLVKNSFTLAWDLYSPETEAAKELDEMRKYRNITHGVGFCIKNHGETKVMLNIAAKHTDINFGLNIIKKRALVYKEVCSLIFRNVLNLEL